MTGPWEKVRPATPPQPETGAEGRGSIPPWEQVRLNRSRQSAPPPTDTPSRADGPPEKNEDGRYLTTLEDEVANYNKGTGGNLAADEWRTAAQGFASWSDEAIAAAKAIPEAVRNDQGFWDAYDKYVQEERQKVENFRGFDPDRASEMETWGMLGSIVSPAVFYNRLRQAGMGLKSALGLTGGASGAVYGSGSANPEPGASWGKAADRRIRGAAAPAAIGATLGPIAGGVGEKIIAPSVDITSKAAARVKDPSKGAYARLSDGLPEGGVDALADSIAQTPVERRALRIIGEEMVAAGGDQAAATTAAINRIATEFGVTPQTAKANLAQLQRRMKNSRLFFAELPSVMEAETQAALKRKPTLDEVRGITDNDTHWTFDMLSNKGIGKSGRDTRNAIARRAGTANASLADDIQKMSPGKQTIEDIAAKIDAAEKAAAADYKRVHDPANNLVDIPRLHQGVQDAVDRHRNTWAMRGGEQKAALDEALKEFDTVLPDGKRIIMPTLQQAQDMRGALRGIITRNQRAGNDHIVQALQPLYQDITRAMQDASPEWAKVNARWADKAIKEKTDELGEAFSMRAGPKYREQLDEFKAMDPELQDIVKINFLQKMKDELDNAVRTGNPARFFSSNHDIKAIEALFGPEQAVAFSRRLRDYNVEEMSKNMTKGSPTHRRGQAQRLGDTEESVMSAAQTANWDGWRTWIMETARNLMTERRDRHLARIGTTPAKDVPQVAEHLERMRTAPKAYDGLDASGDEYGRAIGRTTSQLGVRSKANEERDVERRNKDRLEGRAAGGAVAPDAQEFGVTGSAVPGLSEEVIRSQILDKMMNRMRGSNPMPLPQRPNPLRQPLTPEEQLRLRDMLRELPSAPGTQPVAPGSQNLGDEMPQAANAGGSFLGSAAQGSASMAIPPEYRKRLMDMIRAQPPERRSQAVQDAIREIHKRIDAGSGRAEGGVAKPYDYTPEDDFSNFDLTKYLAGRALRRDGTAGIGNRVSAEVQSYMNEEPVDDILRRYKSADDAFSEDYPITSGVTDTGAAIAGGVLGGGALRGSGSLGSRIANAPHSFKTPLGMAVPPAGATLADNYLNEPDATLGDYAFDGIVAGGLTVPTMMGLGLAIDTAADITHAKKRLKGMFSRKADDVDFEDVGKDAPTRKRSVEKPQESQEPWRTHNLSGDASPRPTYDSKPPRQAHKTAPRVYKKPQDLYYPDMPNAPAQDIRKPTGTAWKAKSKTDETADNFSELYEVDGRVPEYVRQIRKNSASQYIGPNGRYVPISDAKIYERLRRKGLLKTDPPTSGGPKTPPKE